MSIYMVDRHDNWKFNVTISESQKTLYVGMVCMDVQYMHYLSKSYIIHHKYAKP